MLEALALDATYSEAHLKLGEIAYREGQDDEALKQLRPFLEAHPLHPDASYYLAKIYLRKGQIGDAENVLVKMEQKYPKDSRYHYVLAEVYRKAGDPKDADRELTLWNDSKRIEDMERRLRNPSANIE